MKAFKNLFRKKNQDMSIIIVSGLPRSGTSLMMKMLDAGGIAPLTDNIRNSDQDNPKGYYELERVKKLESGDISWLPEAQGKAVKIIFTLLPYLPQSGYTYKTIFMRRNMTEILASQRQMLIRRGKDPDLISDEELSILYENHINETYQWAKHQPNLDYTEVSYNKLMQSPTSELTPLNTFLNDRLDINKMEDILDPALYRQRHSES